MILPDDVKCKMCGRVFCCSKCRINHQEKMHAGEDNHSNKEYQNQNESIDCIICYGQPFVLYPKISDEFLIHIAKKHLPLRCKKCCKFYTSIGDLVLFSKCTNELRHECNLLESKNVNIEDPITSENCTSIGIQTSPYLSAMNTINDRCCNSDGNNNNNVEDDELTPMSMLNLKWKSKIKSGLNNSNAIDSVSSIRNFSSIHSNSLSEQRVSTNQTQIKTIRRTTTTTTSTPMPITTLMKIHRNECGGGGDGRVGILEASSSCQVSSIHSTSSSTESDNSPVALQTPPSPSPLANSNKNIDKSASIQKFKSRGKMRVPVTPLRQVMSKSIQRAIMEHSSTIGAYPKKMIFDSMNNDDSPLDLRTSPAIRRTQSEIIERNSAFEEFNSSKTSTRKQIHFTSKKLTTEYLISSSTSSSSSSSLRNSKILEKSTNTVYKTCCQQSIEVVTTTTATKADTKNIENYLLGNSKTNEANEKTQENNLKINIKNHNNSYLTPKIPLQSAVPLKKTISFEIESPTTNLSNDSQQSIDNLSDEVFYTPLKSSYQMLSSNSITNNKISDNSETNLNDSEKYLTAIENSQFIDNNSMKHSMMKNIKDTKHQFSNKTETINRNNSGSNHHSNNGGLWSFLTSVIRFKSFGGHDTNYNDEKKNGNHHHQGGLSSSSSSLIKRCASFAGVLSKSKILSINNNDDNLDTQSQKRKRTSTHDMKIKPSASTSSLLGSSVSTTSDSGYNLTYYDNGAPAKRFRHIQGRKPIERMRNLM